MFRKFSFAATAALLLMSAAPASAELRHYTLDKPHTQILFFADHIGFSKSEGEFLDYAGTIDFDTAAPEKSKVEVTIKTASLDMGDEKWDTHLKNADFFDVEKFPEMKFISTGIEVTGEKTAKITGDLTIKGITKPVVLDTTYNKSGKHPFSGADVAGFSATTTIKRSDFGITYGAPLMGDDVEIRLEVEGTREAPQNP